MGPCLARSLEAELELEQRWYHPRKPQQTLLKDNEETILREIYTTHKGHASARRILTISAGSLNAPRDALRILRYFDSIINPKKLTYEGLAHVLGIAMYGSRTQLTELMFEAIDRDGSGFLDLHELTEVIELQVMKSDAAAQGSINARAVASDVMHIIDDNGDGVVSLKEFVDAQDIVFDKLLNIERAVM
ncbi:hypothetical protein DIPPA_17077 [Diplonema papillatum]|nr:hypothetical protein DIPPA_17077 [Diplonema papillatum]